MNPVERIPLTRRETVYLLTKRHWLPDDGTFRPVRMHADGHFRDISLFDALAKVLRASVFGWHHGLWGWEIVCVEETPIGERDHSFSFDGIGTP